LVLRVTQLAATLPNQYKTTIDFVVDCIFDVNLLRTSLRTTDRLLVSVRKTLL